MKNYSLELLSKLVVCPSVTPVDAGCQKILSDELARMGFQTETFTSGKVQNLIAVRGNSGPVFAFLGHTDVVPVGALEQWESDPFLLTQKGNFLFGRGVADMKGGISAFITACKKYLEQQLKMNGTILILITSGEEGDHCLEGTPKILEKLAIRNTKVNWCVVGEPSSLSSIGDTIKIGRRGSLSGKLIIKGKQGHIAYPHLAKNPIHLSLKALEKMSTTIWDHKDEFFDPTSFQISNIHAGINAGNVIPPSLEVLFNLRFNPKTTPQSLQEKIRTILKEHSLDYDLTWTLHAAPYFTKKGKLIELTQQIIKNICHYEAQLSTTGGTSDGRYIANSNTEVIELGLCSHSIHQTNEHIKLNDLLILNEVYYRLLCGLLS